MADSAGPYLLAALFCEDATRLPDGTYLLTRPANVVTVPRPETGEKIRETITLYLRLQAGEGGEPARLSLRITTTEGQQVNPAPVPVPFNRPYGAVTFDVPFEFEATREGRLFTDLYLNDRFVSRLALEVKFGNRDSDQPPLGIRYSD